MRHMVSSTSITKRKGREVSFEAPTHMYRPYIASLTEWRAHLVKLLPLDHKCEFFAFVIKRIAYNQISINTMWLRFLNEKGLVCA
jgi:hypothetical protein